MGVKIGEFHRRIARAQQIDRQELARRRQIAGIGFNAAKKLPRGVGKAVNPAFQLAIARAQDGVFHGGQMGLGLVHGAGDAVGLKAVDPGRALVAHRVKAKGHEVQAKPRKGKEGGVHERHRSPCRMLGQTAKEEGCPGQDRAQRLAGQGGAAGNLAGGKGLGGAEAFAGGPCGGQKDAACGQGQHHLARITPEGGDEKGEGRQSQHPRAALIARGRGRRGGPGFGGAVLRGGAELSAETLGHHTPPPKAT